MKNLQTRLLKILATASLFLFSLSSYAQSQKIVAADSLFKAKQYTQSLELYQSIFDQGQYSPSMLLKMAYIQEGLGKIGPTLYDLEVYHRITGEEEAAQKIEELAAKFKLSGYEPNDNSRFQNWLNKKLTFVQAALAIALCLAAYAMFVQKRKNQKPWFTVAGVVVLALAMSYFTNLHAASTVITKDNHTYLMDGPSAG